MTHPADVGTSRAPVRMGRLVWADAGKGLCIMLVVLHHVIGKQYGFVLPDGSGWLMQGWDALTHALKPLRMPLFFVLSGMFASAAVKRPWRDVAGPRIGSPYYLYVVWLCIHAALFSVAQALPMNRTQDLEELLADLVFASTSLWYLYALALYFALAKLVGRWDRRLVLALAIAAVPLSSLLEIQAYNRESILQHFVYFAFGAFFPGVVGRAAQATSGRRTAVLLAAYCVVGAALLQLGAPRGILTLSLALFAVPLGIGAAVALCRALPRLGQATARVGRATLPVYVLHVPLLAAVHQLGWGLPEADPVASVLLAAVYPVAVTLLLTTAAVATHRLVMSTPLRWLFQRPGRSARK